MIIAAPQPFQEAIASRIIRSILPTDFRTRLLREIPAALRERAFFSAGVTKAEFLQRASAGIDELLAGKTDRATQRAGLKQLLQQLGYQPHGGHEGTLLDLSSDARLNLILDTNLELAQGYGHFAEGQNPAILDQWPAQELVRVANFGSTHQRDWAERWVQAGGQFFGGRMIALKDDEVWNQLGNSDLFDDGLDTPYPPFAFNSGMDVQDVDRDTAIAIGLIDRDTQVAPQDRGFNADLQASPDVRDRALKSALQDLFQGAAAFDAGGVLRWLGGAA
ncbi:MAG: hypothetical protein PHE83_05860 [Opitutaceae bacterium]|nr:hypothetical protein [Opitutaceae bacterium]